MVAYEGCATICDSRTGALLIATNGGLVYNGQGNVMPNGSGLAGHDNATQSSLIIPVPRQPGSYYLFTQDAAPYIDPPNGGLSYSIVDMHADAGNGDVTIRNVHLLADATEKLAAVRDETGCGFWVVAHGAGDNRFHAFRVTSRGIDSPIVSSVGTAHVAPAGEPEASASIGWMRFSPDGRRLAVACYASGIVELFDFDIATGIVSNPLRLPDIPYAYGLCFSPDGTMLYVTSNTGDRVPREFKLLQFDVTTRDSSSVAASYYLVARGPDPVPRHYGALQMGPDGVLYMARAGDRFLSTVSRPNDPGSACTFARDGFDLGRPLTSSFGLPNFVDDVSVTGGLDCSLPRAAFTLSDSVVCLGSCVRAFDASTNTPFEWQWLCDGANTPTVSGRDSGWFCFEREGEWTVRLVVSNTFGVDTAERHVRVVPGGTLRGHLQRELSARPGDTVEMRFYVDEVSSMGPETIVMTLNLPPNAMRFVHAVEPDYGDDWSISVAERNDRAGRAVVHMRRVDGKGLDRTGALVDLGFVLFLDTIKSVPVHVSVEATSEGCRSALTTDGSIAVTGCLVQQRQIVVSPVAYALGAPVPNPATGRWHLDLDIGLDGETFVTVVSADGRFALPAIQRMMTAGRHRLSMEGDPLAPGLYLIVVRSGAWSARRTLVVP